MCSIPFLMLSSAMCCLSILFSQGSPIWAASLRFFFFYHCGCFGCLPSPPAPVLWSDQSINPCAIPSQVLGFLVLTTFVPPLGAGFYHGIIKFGKALPGHWAQQLPQHCQAKGASVQATSSSSGLQIRLFLDKKNLPSIVWVAAGRSWDHLTGFVQPPQPSTPWRVA